MRRSLLPTLFGLGVALFALFALGSWNYREIYDTRKAKQRLAAVQSEIAREKEKISVLSAEWAYLNRPERLRGLVELNFDPLRLIPLRSIHFGELEQIAFPKPEEDALENTDENTGENTPENTPENTDESTDESTDETTTGEAQ